MPITVKQMRDRGAAHRRAGRELTPVACQSIDRELFAGAKSQAHPFRWYARMRGAFNRGWQREHFRLVSAD